MDNKTLFGSIAFSSLVILEAIALIKGSDGVMFGSVIGLCGLIAGSVLGFKWSLKQK